MNVQSKPSKLIRGATGDWEVVIGLEVHAQVSSNAKLFSGASTEFGGEPNSHVSLVDAAMPGMLPVINEECIRQAIRTGLGLKAQVNLKSVFDRKNYFYPDLPQGYQISQYKSPIVGEGIVTVDMPEGESFKVGIERLHLEQDAGKSLHDQHPSMSYVDLNRSGVALMEIVSKPDLRSSEDAKAYLRKLRSILRYLGTCDGDMEKGSLRADVNVSVRRPGAGLGTRCEIKNVNSIRFVGEAIEHEARRQIEIIEDGGTIDQETRLFDPNKGETRSMRSKEEAHDYRYFPDPDLLPVEFNQAYVDELNAHLPELPDKKRDRYVAALGLSVEDADVIVADREYAAYFERMIADGAEPRAAAKWFINEYLGQLGRLEDEVRHFALSEFQNIRISIGSGSSVKSGRVTVEWTAPEANSAIVRMIGSKEISGKSAKELLAFVIEIGPTADSKDVRNVVEHLQMKQVTNAGEIEAMVDQIVARNPDKVTDLRTNPRALDWFVGQVMKASRGKANPQAVSDLLKSKLGL